MIDKPIFFVRYDFGSDDGFRPDNDAWTVAVWTHVNQLRMRF